MNQLQQEIENYNWFHSIDLGNGLVTRGMKSLELINYESRAIFGGLDIAGASVLDVGAWNGFFSFEAKRRGAKRVLATDSFVWSHPTYKGKETFDLARSVLRLDIEDMYIEPNDLSVGKVGSFDIVLFLGVFYHLIDPIQALQSVSKIATKAIIVETHLWQSPTAEPAMRFYPGAELNNDPSNWWGPNRAAVEALLSYCGFQRILYQPHPTSGSERGIFHAFRT